MTRPDAELLHLVVRRDGTVHIYVNPDITRLEVDPDVIGKSVADGLRRMVTE